MSWVDDAAQQMIDAGVEPTQAYATAQYMQNAGYSAADVQRGIGETAALFSAKPAEEIRQATGYQGHIPTQQIDLGSSGQPVDVANFVRMDPSGQLLPAFTLDVKPDDGKPGGRFQPLPDFILKGRQQLQEPSTPAPTAAPSPFRGVFTSTMPAAATPAPSIIKTPERFLSTFQENITAQSLEKLLFENIGGIELANIIRHDTVEGTNPYYKIISNLSRIRLQLDPISLVASQRASLTPGDFGRQITLFTKIPLQNYLDNNNLDNYIFIDNDDTSSTYGHLIIELINLDADEFVEVEIATSGTIYEVEQ